MARAADFASARIDGLITRSFFALRRFALDRAEKRKWVAYAENSCEQRRLQVAFGLWRATVAQRNLAARQNAADITANGVFPQGSLDASLLPRSLLPPAQPFVGLPAAKEASELGGLDEVGSHTTRTSEARLGKELSSTQASREQLRGAAFSCGRLLA